MSQVKMWIVVVMLHPSNRYSRVGGCLLFVGYWLCSPLSPPSRYDNFVFDCDGVLWGGSHSIDGSRESKPPLANSLN